MCPPTTAAVPTTAVVRTAIRAIGRLLNMSCLLSCSRSNCRRQVRQCRFDQLVGYAGALQNYPTGSADGLGERSGPYILPDQQGRGRVHLEGFGNIGDVLGAD